LARYSTEMVAFEIELAVRLEEAEGVLRPYPGALSTVEGFRQMVAAQRDWMASYLESMGVQGSAPSGFTYPAGAGAGGALRRLQPPRPESELARAGIQGGERLLAMDGNEVHSIGDIQKELFVISIKH
jgi:hypothetical protein